MTTSVDLDQTTVTSRRSPAPKAVDPQLGARMSRGRLALLAAGVASVALAGAAVVGGAAGAPVVSDPGVLTRWGLLVLRTVYDIGGMATIGVLVVAVVLVPAAAVLSDEAQRLVRTAGRWSAVWAGTGALSVLLVLSDVTGLPVWKVLAPDMLALATELPQTRALLSSAWLAALVAFGARRCQSVTMGRLLLVTGLGAFLPLLLTGHTGHGDQQVAAVLGLATHVTAASVWVGGLLALGVYLRSSQVLAVALPRYSRVALGCFTLVALSGVVMAWVALRTPSDLLTTPYGRLLLAKAALLGALGVFGHWHRRRTLPAVAAWRPRAFVALAAVELVVMAAAAGLAVGLSRTAPPDGGDHAASVVSTTIDARGIQHLDRLSA